MKKQFLAPLLTIPLLFLNACSPNLEEQSQIEADGPVIEVETQQERPTEEKPKIEEEKSEEDENEADVVMDLTGENFKFMMDGEENPEIRVKEGETITVNFKSNQGFHDWVVDEFDAQTEQVQKDGKTSVTFVASKKGTFEYYCSVGDHRERGMKGIFIVE